MVTAAMVIATHTPDDYMESVTRMAEFTTVVQLRRMLSKYVFGDKCILRVETTCRRLTAVP